MGSIAGKVRPFMVGKICHSAFATDHVLEKTLSYTNSKGIHYTDPMLNAVLHMFNHQTHHRGQVHVMLSQTEIQPPSLDMHRILNP